MQAGYRRDPSESTKALKAKVKGKKRDTILYGAVIKQQSNLASIGNVPPPTPPTTGAPVGLPSIGSSQPTNDKMAAYEKLAKEAPYKFANGPKGAIDEKMIQERLAQLKKHDQTVTKSAMPTTKEKMESAMRDTKASLKPHDSRVPNVGINSNPQGSTVAPSEMTSRDDMSDISQMTASAAPTIPAARAMDPVVQDLAKTLLARVNEIRTREKVGKVKQVTITAYAYDGKDTGARVVVKQESETKYRFDLTPQSAYDNKNLMKDDQGINIPDSITAALNKVSNGSYNAKASPGELNGLGFNESDPTKISSSRIAWMNARAAGKKLPKGMIYVMAPSLLKGNLSIYSKSGRPIMSVSKISPAFQRIVRDTIDRNTFDPQDFSSIEPSESADVNHFISISKPIAPSGIDRLANADSIWKLKKRYEVLVGELSAGNDGLVVRQEMEAILRSLMRMHSINPTKAKDLIKALHDY